MQHDPLIITLLLQPPFPATRSHGHAAQSHVLLFPWHNNMTIVAAALDSAIRLDEPGFFAPRRDA